MNNTDLITMLGNLSRSIQSIETMVLALSYLVGIMLIYIGLLKLKNKAGSIGHSQEPNHVAFAFILGGIVSLFLPTAIRIGSNSAFGTQNILQYTNYNSTNIFQSLGVLIQVSGLYWFVRGCILLVQGSKPGKQEGKKGLFYLCAGVLALNFTLTSSAVSYIIDNIVQFVFTFKKVK